MAIDFENQAKRRMRMDNYGPNWIGNVIRIIDNRTVIVNAGSDKLKAGQEIKIYSPVEPIKDLDGTILCDYEYTKDLLEVIDVNSGYSVCRKMKTKTSNYASNLAFALSPLLEGKETYVPLDIEEKDIRPFKEIDKKIRIGDPIKLA